MAGISEEEAECLRPVITVLPAALGKQLVVDLLAHPEVGTDQTSDTTAPSHLDPMSV